MFFRTIWFDNNFTFRRLNWWMNLHQNVSSFSLLSFFSSYLGCFDLIQQAIHTKHTVKIKRWLRSSIRVLLAVKLWNNDNIIVIVVCYMTFNKCNTIIVDKTFFQEYQKWHSKPFNFSQKLSNDKRTLICYEKPPRTKQKDIKTIFYPFLAESYPAGRNISVQTSYVITDIN